MFSAFGHFFCSLILFTYRFASKLKQKFKDMRKPRNVNKFLEENTWLNTTFLDEYSHVIAYKTAGPGRPRKEFCDLSEQQKRRRTSDLRESVSPEKIKHAAKSILYSEGGRTAAAIVNDLIYSLSRPMKIKKN